MKTIRSIELHAAINLHGTKVLGAITIGDPKHPGASFAVDQYGIEVSDTGNDGKVYSVLVPWANVKQVLYKPEMKLKAAK